MRTFTFKYNPSEPSIGKRIWQAAEGKPHVRPNEMVSSDLKSLLQIASESRIELFGTILREKPASLYELAEKIGKSQPYILKEARVLEGLGLIKLHREMDGGRERIRPEALYDRIVIDCGFKASKAAS